MSLGSVTSGRGRVWCGSLSGWLGVALVIGGCGASEEDCAKGTKLKNGVCVADGSAKDSGAPRVDELIVKYLAIDEESDRPLYLMHPMTVSLGIEVNAQPFKSDVVIGLSSEDGTKHCAAGYIELVFTGGADAGVDRTAEGAKNIKPNPVSSNRGELSLQETLFVQPRCKKLIGEKKAKVWIAVDPFRRLAFASDKRLGGTPEPTSLAAIDDFLYASRWPLDFCESSHKSGHPKNCNSVFEVQDTPGLDIILRKLQPSSSVLTVEPLPLAVQVTPDLRDADLFANITTVTYGAEFKKLKSTEGDPTANADNPLSDLDYEFFFMIRPDVELTDLPPGVDASDVDWEPLHVITKGAVKAENGNPKLERLLQQFLSSLETAVKRQVDVPMIIPKELHDRLRIGNWRRYSKFQLLSCVEPDFEEAKAKGISANNNCQVEPLIISRHEFADKPLVGGHHKGYEVTPKDTKAEVLEFKWAEDPKNAVNKCKDENEARPQCVSLGEHKKVTKCYHIPDYKVTPISENCHCCYPKDAFDQHLAFAHEPEIGFTLGSNESIGIRTRVWWTTHLTNKSMFEPQPLKARSTVGFDATLVGWWTRGLLYVDTPIQLGIAPGIQSYWWPEMAVLGFTLWDEKYVIDEDDPLFEIQQLAAKEWTQNFCQTFCVQIVCFDVCAQIGASVRLQPGVQINEKNKEITGELKPEAAAIAGGSVGLNLFLGVVGIKIVFDKFIAFATPVQIGAQFLIKQATDPLKVDIKGKAEYRLELDVLEGSIAGFWTPKWGGGDQELDLYEWDGLLYAWSLWLKERVWHLEL